MTAFEDYQTGNLSAKAFGHPVPEDTSPGKRLSREEIRNRLGYHAGTDETIPMHEKVREAYISMAEFLATLLEGCEQWAVDQVFVNLQQTSMWTNFAVALKAPVQEQQKYNITNFDDLSDVARTEATAPTVE